MTTTIMVDLYYVNTLGWSIYDYYHYGRSLTLIHSAEVYDYYQYERPLTSIHSTEVFIATTTMVGL
jgi:hypothetical protein